MVNVSGNIPIFIIMLFYPQNLSKVIHSMHGLVRFKSLFHSTLNNLFTIPSGCRSQISISVQKMKGRKGAICLLIMIMMCTVWLMMYTVWLQPVAVEIINTHIYILLFNHIGILLDSEVLLGQLCDNANICHSMKHPSYASFQDMMLRVLEQQHINP